MKIPEWNAKGSAAIIIPTITVTNVNRFSKLRAMDVGINPRVVNVVCLKISNQVYLYVQKNNNEATIALYIIKIIQIVESNCLNFKTLLPTKYFIHDNFVSG